MLHVLYDVVYRLIKRRHEEGQPPAPAVPGWVLWVTTSLLVIGLAVIWYIF